MKLKEPPMIVLMDILALFLFIFMINKNKAPSFRILLPEGVLDRDCYEIHRDEDNRLRVVAQGEERSYQTIAKQNVFAFRIPCDAVAGGCHQGAEGVLVVGETAQKAMKRFADACFSTKRQCNVTVSITRSGVLSIDSIADMQP